MLILDILNMLKSKIFDKQIHSEENSRFDYFCFSLTTVPLNIPESPISVFFLFVKIIYIFVFFCLM